MATIVTGDQSIRIGNKLAEIQRQLYLQRDGYPYDPVLLEDHLQAAVEGKFAVVQKQQEISETTITTPSLRSTPPTLATWLTAREKLHTLFTDETVILRDLFALTDEELASTTLMPAFRPKGATNRNAIEWKLKMGETQPYEKVDVMKYTNSKGLKEPELYLINRSLTPDEDTLGDNAKSPDKLIEVPNKLWLGLYGWCDADTLHHAITGEHLDPNTCTWFPEDRLHDDRVARGRWSGSRVLLYWGVAGDCGPSRGARSAKKVPLKT